MHRLQFQVAGRRGGKLFIYSLSFPLSPQGALLPTVPLGFVGAGSFYRHHPNFLGHCCIRLATEAKQVLLGV